MGAPEIPFDVSYVMPDGLRAEPVDAESMAAGVDWLEAAAHGTASRSERARLFGLAGGYAGILRDLARAERLLREAAEMAAQGSHDRLGVVLRIRLADVLAMGGDSEAAIELLRSLLDPAAPVRAADDQLDFVHQHLGKALLEAGQADAALEHLEHAFQLREVKADPDLLASTRAAIDTARRSVR